MIVKKIAAMLLSVMMLLGLASCTGGQSSTGTVASESTGETIGSEAAATKTIAVVPWDMSQEFAAAFAKACQEEIEGRGWNSIVLDPGGDWNQAVQILEDLIVQQVDGIVYTAIDASAAGAMIDKVHEAGIPIIDYDCVAAAGNADASIVYDNYRGGQMAAEQMMNALDGKEDAVVMVYEEDPSISSSGMRNNGFTDYLSENFPGVTVIKNRAQDRSRDGCRGWAVDMVTSHPEVDGYFCYWGDCALGAWYGLQEAGATETIMIGYDATDEHAALMRGKGPDCTFYASIAMFPEQYASSSLEYMEKIFDGTYQRQGPDDIITFDPELLLASEAENWQ